MIVLGNPDLAEGGFRDALAEGFTGGGAAHHGFGHLGGGSGSGVIDDGDLRHGVGTDAWAVDSWRWNGARGNSEVARCARVADFLV